MSSLEPTLPIGGTEVVSTRWREDVLERVREVGLRVCPEISSTTLLRAEYCTFHPASNNRLEAEAPTNAMAISFAVGVVLILIASASFGLYVGLRKNFCVNMDNTTFLIANALAQFAFAVLLYASYSAPQAYATYSFQALYIFLGGFVSAMAEYLFLTAAVHLHSATIVAFASIPVAFATLADYYIDPDGVNIDYLVLGMAIMAVGLVIITLSEYKREEVLAAFESCCCSHEKVKVKVDDSDEEERSANDTTALVAPGGEDAAAHKKPDDWVQEFWLLLGAVAGILACGWSIFVLLGETGEAAITDPALILIIFQGGGLSAVPVAVTIFGYFDVIGISEYKINNFCDITNKFCSVPGGELAWAFFIGTMISGGYAAYFYGCTVIPTAISFAITSCSVAIAALAGLFFFCEYSPEIIGHVLIFMTIGTIVYGVSIYVFLEYAYE